MSKVFEEILIFKIKAEWARKILTSGCNVYGHKFSGSDIKDQAHELCKADRISVSIRFGFILRPAAL